MALDVERGYLGEGDVYFDRWDANNASTGLVSLGNATSFVIKANNEIKELVSRQRNKRGTVLAVAPIPQPSTFSFVLTNVVPTNLALALMGTQASASQGSGTATNAAVSAKLDAWVPLPHRNVSAVTVTGPSATPVYVLNTDYELDLTKGWVRALSSGSITADEALEVDYTYSAVTATQVSGATDAIIRGQIIFEGRNYATGADVQLKIPQALVVSDSEVDWLSEDFMSLSFSGRAELKTGETAAFYVTDYAT